MTAAILFFALGWIGGAAWHIGTICSFARSEHDVLANWLKLPGLTGSDLDCIDQRIALLDRLWAQGTPTPLRQLVEWSVHRSEAKAAGRSGEGGGA